MACNISTCCNFFGNLKDCAENCEFYPGGYINLYIGDWCQLDYIAQYSAYYQGSTQASLFTTAYGNPLVEGVDDFNCALYPKNAISDIVMKAWTGAGSLTNFPLFEIKSVLNSGSITNALQGGDGTAALYNLSTFTVQVPNIKQGLLNTLNQLSFSKVFVIIETATPFPTLATEVNSLLATTNPVIIENRHFMIGAYSGLKMTSRETTLGGDRDTLSSASTLTFESVSHDDILEIVPFIDSDYNNPAGTGTAAGYIAAPYNVAPYNVQRPICNLITKLLTGDA